MKCRALLIATIVLPLAACGSGADVNEKNASVEEVAEKVREVSDEDGLVNPGKWVSTVKIENVDLPGMPAEAAEQMKQMIAQTHTNESCVTPEEAKQPKGDFFGGNENCRYDHFKMGNGKIDAQMRCEQDGVTQVMKMDGTYSPDAYSMRMTSTMNSGAPGGNMSMEMKVDARRAGACTGNEA